MCYDDNARPPIPNGANGKAHGEDLVLSAADGNRFAAYFARPEQASSAQVIIFPDVRGLHQFYKELALRFAEMGVTALALDYFGRTAGLTARDDSFEFMPHVQQMQLDSFAQDVQASLNYLRTHGGEHTATFIVGFCMGGSMSLYTAMHKDLGLSGVIAFYAGLSRAFGGGDTVLQQANKVSYPVLGLFGGADQGIPVDQVKELEQTLNQQGVENTVVVYEGAPHSFFDRRQETYAEESADAWQRIQGFIAAHK
ncbi:MAG TPA: dienelactone hydrolase family protein [Ktedonobacteraceae bacterium]|jgi:carboxymethylenebutenolidase|nr:dienelactone hydrolase family protein [Ktedonobacteraceae bacterium]